MSHRTTIATATLLGVICLLTYLLTRSMSYDDFDSYNFGLAVTQFDLSLQQPQPPGFPLYILVAQGINAVIQNPLISLTTLSALTGALAVVALFFIGTKIFYSPLTAFFVALIFGMMPIQWLTSVKALSDSAGVMTSLVAILLLWVGLVDTPTNHVENGDAKKSPLHKVGRGFRGGDKRLFIIGAFALGLSLGVRPQANYFGFLLYGFGAGWLFFYKKDWRTVIFSGIAVGAGVLIWLIPTLSSVGGLDRYLALIAQHGEHVGTSDSLFSAGMTLQGRINDFLETFFLPTFGISLYRPVGFAEWLIIGGCALWLMVGVFSADYRKISTWVIVVWFLVMIIPYFLFTSLNRPRLMLPCIPPLLLWGFMGWERILRGNNMRCVVGMGGAVALTVLFISQSLPLGIIISTIPAPHDQASAYIRQNYPSDQTAVAVAGSYRTAQTALGDYRALFYRYQYDPVTVQAQIHAENYGYIAILDRDGFGDVISSLDDDGRYVPIDDQLFYRDERVHWEHHQTRLQVLMPLDQITADRLMLPDEAHIDIADDGKFLGAGWFRPEDMGGVWARWGGDNLTSELRVTLPQQNYVMEFFATPFVDGAGLRVVINGVPMGEFILMGGWNTYRVELPMAVIPQDDFLLIEFVHEGMQAPYEVTGGASSDRRRLTVAYAWVRFIGSP